MANYTNLMANYTNPMANLTANPMANLMAKDPNLKVNFSFTYKSIDLYMTMETCEK